MSEPERGSQEYDISASQVKTFSKCPKQWWFRYRSDREKTKRDSKYISVGLRVHEAIEDMLTQESPPPLSHEPSVRASIREFYKQKDEHELPEDSFQDGLDYCDKAAKFISKHDPRLRGVEVELSFSIDREEISSGVSAIIDVATENEIWDWKTGSIRDDTAHEEKIQGPIYMGAYYEEYGEIPESIAFIYLKEGEVRRLNPEDEIWEYMVKEAKALVEAKEGGDFPAKPGENCFWCGWELWCDESPVGVGDVDWGEY